MKTCSFDNCCRPVCAKNLCRTHYCQQWRGVAVRPIGEKKVSAIERRGEVGFVRLFNKARKEIAQTVFDWEDAGLVEGRCWYLSARGYVRCAMDGGGRTACLHRIILGVHVAEMLCDHIDGNRLNNRRSNLRIVTRAQNSQNRATPGRDRGIVFSEGSKLPWRARVKSSGRHYAAGPFATKDEAIDAVRQLRAKHFTHHNEQRHPSSVIK